MDEAVRAAVHRRANYRCEYCRLTAAHFPFPFHVEHVIPRKHDGPTVAGNLALACQHCNEHKGSDLAGLDRRTSRSKLVRLFNPRRHRWAYHFAFDGPRIVGRTPIGRVTVRLLNMNDRFRVRLREEWADEGLWPPPDDPAAGVSAG